MSKRKGERIVFNLYRDSTVDRAVLEYLEDEDRQETTSACIKRLLVEAILAEYERTEPSRTERLLARIVTAKGSNA